jgi:hypothetical protein
MNSIQNIEIGKFTFKIPNGWSYQIDDGIFTIFDDKNGVGAIQISHFETPTERDIDVFDEFYDFISETILITKNEYDFYNKIEEIKPDCLVIKLNLKDRFYIFCMFYYDYSVLFITYNCEIGLSGREETTLKKFLENIETR